MLSSPDIKMQIFQQIDEEAMKAVTPKPKLPEHKFTLCSDDAGSLKLVGMTPELANKENIVYQITQVSTGRHYVGRAFQPEERLLQHLEAAENSTPGSKDLYKEIKADHKDFELQYLHQSSSSLSLAWDESRLIAKQEALAPKGFNGNKGNQFPDPELNTSPKVAKYVAEEMKKKGKHMLLVRKELFANLKPNPA